MQLIKIIYKIVESPKSSENYHELLDYFTQNNMAHYANAISHLIKVKYATDHSDTPEQIRSE